MFETIRAGNFPFLIKNVGSQRQEAQGEAGFKKKKRLHPHHLSRPPEFCGPGAQQVLNPLPEDGPWLLRETHCAEHQTEKILKAAREKRQICAQATF